MDPSGVGMAWLISDSDGDSVLGSNIFLSLLLPAPAISFLISFSGDEHTHRRHSTAGRRLRTTVYSTCYLSLAANLEGRCGL